MSRKKKHEEHVNHERWAIPYADLITLLLALFVVLYAVSVVNTSKFKAMSESMSAAFNGTTRSDHPSISKTDGDTASMIANHGTSSTTLSKVMQMMKLQDDERRHLDLIQAQVAKALHPLIAKQLIRLNRGPTELEIEIRTDILFPSGVATLSGQANDVLDQIAHILQPFSNPVRVEGYTDDVPINTTLYPSNWELSAGRAASVARLFSQNGIDASRLGIEGWADNNPLGDNSTEDGRNRNRRVVVVVLGNHSGVDRFTVDPGYAPAIMQADSDHKAGATGPSAAPAPVPTPPPAVAPQATNAATAPTVKGGVIVVYASHKVPVQPVTNAAGALPTPPQFTPVAGAVAGATDTGKLPK